MLKDAFIKCDSDMVDKIQQDLKRRAEQEYLLQNMVKGAMYEAAEIANRYQVGIAVRGTGLLAHMGIESGDPTKPQEFKSKTSKEEDLWLCNELEWRDLGAVVHYDPRVGWTSQEAESHARNNKKLVFDNQPTDEEWLQKWRYIQEIREPKLRRLVARIKQPPDEEALCKQFFERAKEYISYDYDYRHGDFAPYTTIHGPFIRLKVRPDVNIVGDHDLFAFTFPANDYGRLASVDIPEVTKVQIALQKANTFQAQHDSIMDWNPQKNSNLDIKDRIMKAHSPNSNSPLVYIQPGNIITAAYYIPLEKKLSSVWDNSLWTEWLKTTHSGELYLSFVKQAENRSGESL